MADLSGSIFAALQALYAADTGSGGLNENSDTSAAKVRFFQRSSDPNFAEDRPANWPAIFVFINEEDTSTFGGRHSVLSIRMAIKTQRDQNTATDGITFTSQDAVCSRVFTVFDGVTPATQGGFTFTVGQYIRSSDGPAASDESTRIMEFIVSSPGTDLIGANASITTTVASGANPIASVANGVLIDTTFDEAEYDVTRFGDVHERITTGVNRGTLVMEAYIGTTTPPIPRYAEVSVVFTLATNQTYTGTGVVTRMAPVARTGPDRHRVRYTVRFTATGVPGTQSVVAA